MNYNGILQFKGTWRNYQARVLENAEKYMADGKVHIVAAPGSGKTTLGIELMKRMSEPALVLAPSITIREQWVARIADAFLCEGIKPEDYLSQNLREPRAITVATYQALHSAMSKYAGTLDETERQETVDFAGFDLISMIKDNCIGVLCLDECHHLRSEWWKALEELRSECSNLKVIALTATPPYDSTPAMWKRYMSMCGEIDEEITIPELVKEGSLCPHQDFVYFNYPTEDELAEVKKFEQRGQEMLSFLMQDSEFCKAIQSHQCLNGSVKEDKLLEQPSYLAAILIFLKEKGIAFPAYLKRLLGAKQLPKMDAGWMEKLLQGFLYEDTDSYDIGKEYPEKLADKLKAAGLIEKKKVSFTANEGLEKLITNSKGKANSIREIVFHEYQATGEGLRLLVLTDYIRKEYEKAVGNLQSDINSLGVLPFFEMLRREAEQRTGNQTDEAAKKLRIGVLCGTIVIIPAEAKEALEKEVEGIGNITFSPIGSLPETDYVKVNVVGNAHFLTGAVTNIFTKGYMQVLVGTKSLLGEGWDSPCINSLILASFVGSFMLSNQMRGRAIRVFKEQPDKTSNIWHLVCLKPWDEVENLSEEEISEDYSLLSRRMEHFLGLHYTENSIESGMNRLSIIKSPFNNENVNAMNQQMLTLSAQRDQLKERWQSALSCYKKMDVVEETEVAEKAVSAAVFKDTLSKVILSGIVTVILLISFIGAKISGKGISMVLGILFAAGLLLLVSRFPKLSMLATPLKRLKAVGMGVRKALLQQNLLETDASKVMAEAKKAAVSSVYLAGGSSRDKELFTKCVKEFFAVIDNQRYILVKNKARQGLDGFYCVPECFAKRKEDAEQFAACLKPYIGEYELVYTRSEKGRELLLEGRIRALANRNERCLSHKKVKGALE